MEKHIDFKEKITAYFSDVKSTLDKVDLEEINAAMNILMDAYIRGSCVYCFGNGGSASTATHMLNDFNKGISYNLDRKFRFYCLNDNVAMLTAISNDLGYENVYITQLKGHLKAGDIVVAISGSGNAPNIIRAVEYAKDCGCSVIGISGYNGGKLRQLADYHMHAPIDDMQVVEDMHLIFNHMMMRLFCQTLDVQRQLLVDPASKLGEER